MIKKAIAIILLICIMLLASSCKSNIINNNNSTAEEHSLTNENTNKKDNKKYGTYEIIDGTKLLKINLTGNKNDYIISDLEIIDLSNDTIVNQTDLTPFSFSNEMKILILNNNIIIIDNAFYIFSLNGEYIKTINYPEDTNSSSPITISNDLSKIAYISTKEIDDETVYELNLFDVNLIKKQIIQNINKASKSVPCDYSSLSFSNDDKFLLYSGLKFNNTSSEECYGKINLQSNKITMYPSPNHDISIKNNIISIFDYSPNYGQNSSGNVSFYDVNSNNKNTITLENQNESQYLRSTIDEKYFCTANVIEKNHTVEFTVYKDNKKYKTKTISFEKDSFERTTTHNWKFSFVPELNKLVYELYTFDENNENDWGTKELKIIDL